MIFISCCLLLLGMIIGGVPMYFIGKKSGHHKIKGYP